MKKIFIISLVFLSCFICFGAEEERVTVPDGTYLFAERDTCNLYFDLYRRTEGSETTIEGKEKPTVLFVFGGGFITGSRNDKGYLGWFKELQDNGYNVVSIDYRLGLKGQKKVGVAQADIIFNAIQMAVDDLFSATNYIIEHSEELSIDPYNIVTSGSSAGAITVMQAEYEICNGMEYSKVLPEGFNYAGVMSFAGGIGTTGGGIDYKSEPCPTLMLHGTSDKIVDYNKKGAFGIGLYGSNSVAKNLEKKGYFYDILRFKDHQHEIAASMAYTVKLQMAFIETNVMKGARSKVDAMIDDPRVPQSTWSNNLKDLYK